MPLPNGNDDEKQAKLCAAACNRETEMPANSVNDVAKPRDGRSISRKFSVVKSSAMAATTLGRR